MNTYDARSLTKEPWVTMGPNAVAAGLLVWSSTEQRWVLSLHPYDKSNSRDSGHANDDVTEEVIDPDVYSLVQARNEAGRATTVASSQGHWHWYVHLSEPYIAFGADQRYAEQFDINLIKAFREGRLTNQRQMAASVSVDRRQVYRLSTTTHEASCPLPFSVHHHAPVGELQTRIAPGHSSPKLDSDRQHRRRRFISNARYSASGVRQNHLHEGRPY